MKFRIFALLLALLLLFSRVNANVEEDDQNEEEDQDEDDITHMTFLVEHEPETENDYIQINLEIKTEDSSLSNALAEATALLAKVTALGENYCQNYPEEDVDCDDVVDADDYDIEAKYQPIRKELKFMGFTVTYDVTISVYHTDKIGELADQLLKAGVSQLNSFDWASSEEDDSEEDALQAGKEKSHDMCFHLGMKLHRIVAVDQVIEEGGDEGGDGGEEGQGEEEEQEEDAEILAYEFEIECILDEETAARKAEEEAEEAEEEDDQDDEDEDDEEDDEDNEDEEDEDEEDEEEEDEEEEEEEEPKKKSKKSKKK